MLILIVLLVFFIILIAFEEYTDHLKFKPFQEGNTIELLKLKHIALDDYEIIGQFKIIARKNADISTINNEGKIFDFNLYDLISIYDKIVVKDKNNNTYIIEKEEGCDYEW